MSEHQLKANSVEETGKIAEKLALFLKPGDVVTLEGDLGTGKTTFTKGIANGLGIKRNVNSPTYTIVKEYEGELPLYHMDVYRLENSDEDIGFDEYFNGDGISIVEWAHFIEEFLPDERLNIKFSYLDDCTRLLEFTAIGTHFEWITAELFG
ncbi:tRNA threonylcarbamoyladenosine biosynthesis protein TsaE [Virgibacillus subterraneus]|uniref:tRNA threonylcarbamoyladenosine biosynthesis protein TsaE n=2 Tax=Virgibacillus TaxID=84406 RepID=A0A1H1GIC3_9BACI|nr:MULTISPECIES: tRNA (adenosine(37)-N6)-threonylcarbamoyltransferase complex ATPase subunit type 1 TsaE [Virgibacillus]SDR12930.1 tRNA threonylcarbamoyladenosine biosynthesis protein TsaE [Virgibacillus salinus]SEQ80829.1 tRNA threonylcarbamoyladenosine biosynthesis protein TsaE [Virgibacillus subterraneus]